MKQRDSGPNRPKDYVNLIQEPPHFDTPPDGEAVSICKVCGQPFEQHLVVRQNRYTSFKKCPKHRHTSKGDDPAADEVLRVELDYRPHPKQQLFHDSGARFRVLNCGSRFGKDRATTMEAITYFLACLNEERPTDIIPTVYWWICAPSERMAKQNWTELKRYFPKELVVDLSNSGMILNTIYGGVIEVRSAYDPESLVGVGLDIVTITEAARIADLEIVWANLEQRLNSPGRGLNGTGGIGIINSSPKGRNYFYKMWCWGQKEHPDYDPDWESWTFTTWDNPAMAVKGDETKLDRHNRPVSYRERLRRRLGLRRYEQDILARFLSGETKCFPGFMEKCVVRVPDELDEEGRADFVQRWREPQPLASYVAGYDPAKIQDIPPLVVVDEATGACKRIIDMRGHSWNGQYNTIASVATRYNGAVVAFGRTGHETINEELEKLGVQTLPLSEQGHNKENYITRLEGIVEQGLFKVLDDGSPEADELIAQFCDYSRIEKNGRVVFGNVDEPHDDYVSAVYFAFQAIVTPDEALPSPGFVVGIKV